ncbi:MAG: S8 family serine peptidase, partial [Candidatus Micrarchaeia archaeon]
MLNLKYGASAEKLLKKTSIKDLDRLYILKLPRNSDIKKIVEEYNKDPSVEYAEPDYVVRAVEVPNDPYFYLQWGLNNSGQLSGTPGADVDALDAWDIINGSDDVVVAVIDTGVDYTHPDLEDNMWTNPIDGSHGWDFYNNDNDPMDDYGHGTHCAGIIGAVGNNSVGVAGVNWRVKIAALKFLSADGYGYTSGAISAINYANIMGFRILSNSWGGGGYSKALYDAISGYNTASANNTLFIAAAGNSGSNNDASPTYPCSYNLPNIICVAATDNNDSLASFSNYGATTVDVGAPGVDIYSTLPTGTCELCDPSGYGYLSGTSMATPFVSGAAALIKAKYPDLNASQIKARIMYSVDRLDSLDGKVVSNGRLNLYNALHEDDTPPAAISDLEVAVTGVTNVTLSWTAVGDDGNEGNATYYEIRYSTSEITEENFNYATLARNTPTPGENGSAEEFTVTGLLPETTYYFAIKVYDEVGNPSDLSNVVSTTTLEPPTIPGCDYLVYTSNYLINKNNSRYCLFTDLSASEYGVLFANRTQNTTLDCRGYTIYGSGTYSYFGIYVGLYAVNNTIRNCNVQDFYWGVALDYSSRNNNLTNITANSNVFGIEPYYSNYNIFRNITAVNNTDDGLTLEVADYNKFENVYLSAYADASADGIIYSDDSWHNEFVNVT